MTVDLCVGYPAPIAGLINIGLLHTSADGRPGHERYAPCTVDSLVNRGFDYFALGHVHEREVLSADPPVVFCGALQGRGLHEAGRKGATLIDFDDGRIPTSTASSTLCAGRLSKSTLRAARTATRSAAAWPPRSVPRQATPTAASSPRRWRSSGPRMHTASCSCDSERLSHEVALAAADGAGAHVWVQGTVVRTSSPRPRIAAGDDAVGELVAELEEILADEASLADVGKVLESLAGALPVAVLEEFNPTDPDVLRSLMEGVCESLPLALTEAPD